jgi:hypothetical protein
LEAESTPRADSRVPAPLREAVATGSAAAAVVVVVVPWVDDEDSELPGDEEGALIPSPRELSGDEELLPDRIFEADFEPELLGAGPEPLELGEAVSTWSDG